MQYEYLAYTGDMLRALGPRGCLYGSQSLQAGAVLISASPVGTDTKYARAFVGWKRLSLDQEEGTVVTIGVREDFTRDGTEIRKTIAFISV